MITRANLEQLDSWLTANWPTYRSMIEGGSVAAGDPQIEGRSDWEIAIVADEITDEDMDKLRNFMTTLPQDDRVEIVYRITDQLLSHSSDMHYLTGKFRSKTLHGENLIDKIPLPSREVIESFWLDRLKMTVKQIDKYTVNSPIWSDEKIRYQFRPVFKNIFLALQVKVWCENGKYPVSRQDLVDRFPSDELKTMWKTLHGINDADRQTILNTAKLAKLYLQKTHLPVK